ncbi:hypothetical protein ACWDSJ_28195 [Nocardia sp. NPDC003482]
MTETTATYPRPTHVGHVRRLWPTNVALSQVPDSELPDVPADLEKGAAVSQSHPIETIPDHTSVQQLFVQGMQRLADGDRNQGLPVVDIDRVNLELQVWRPGFEAPVWVEPGPYLGWLFLSATPSQHSDSGSIAVLDPRAGSSMSAVPGLPWGASLVIKPQRGSLAIVPGWLTSSVVPLEQHQTCVVVVATVGPNDAG